MNGRMTLSGLLCLLAAAGFAAEEKALVPGYLTDRTADYGAKLAAGEYVTPAAYRYPYIATHYVKPTVTPDEPVKIGYWVTDWENSLERRGDASFRFDVELKLRRNGGKFRSERQTGVSCGDHAFELGKLPEGDWIVGVRCFEKRSGLPSHWVWQRFRVVDSKKLAITEKETYRVSAADLKTYGLDNRGAFSREVKVAAPKLPEGLKDVTRQREFVKAYVEKYADEHPSKGSRGYAVYVPYHENGQCLHHAFMQSAVRYDADYDGAAVERMSARNSAGIQRLLEEKRAAGYRKIVWLPGTYRVTATNSVRMLDGLTLDLNGATLKMNEFTGCRAMVVRFQGTMKDAHLVNGTIETDYFEHDYGNSESASEWVMGAAICGDCSYCSIENMDIRDITGYGLHNGHGGAGNWYLARPRSIAGSIRGETGYVRGLIDARTGAVVPSGTHFTGGFTDITEFVPFGFVDVSRNMGYQGLGARSWYVRIAFYDRDRKFLSSEVAFQYRKILLPAGACYARTSVEAKDEEEMKTANLHYCRHTIPYNCVVRGNRLFRCRAVGYAPAQMQNWLIEGNEFSHCGETLAACAFDAEDGWDQMQDVLIRDNVFHDNARSELLTCAGHNFTFIGNRATICLWDRTLAPTVRDNDLTRLGYCYPGGGTSQIRCGNHNRTLHARIGRNRWGGGVSLGCTQKRTDWDVVIRGETLKGSPGKPILLGSGTAGRFVDCTVSRAEITDGNFENCTISDSTASMIHQDDFGSFRQCRFRDFSYSIGYWHKPVSLRFVDCDITVGGEPFLKTPLYSIGRIGFDGGTVRFAETKTPLVHISDFRENVHCPNPDDAKLAIVNTTVSGTAPSLVRVGAMSQLSDKPFKVWKKGVKGTAPVPLFDATKLPSHWTVVEK